MIKYFTLLAAAFALRAAAESPAQFAVTGDWQVRVMIAEPRAAEATLAIQPPQTVAVLAEKFDILPIYNPNGGGWNNGARLAGLLAQNTTTPFLLDAASLVLSVGADAGAEVFRRGEDYEAESSWGTFGRLAKGKIGETTPVFASYRYTPLRLDSVVLGSDGRIVVRTGQTSSAAPRPVTLQPGDRLLGNIWLPGPIAKLSPDLLFPILESSYPALPPASPSLAEKVLPKTLGKLRAGVAVRVLAWGDSVTECGYLPVPDEWQQQFVTRLRERFPTAQIELVTVGWGGRNTQSFLTQPPGSPHNFKEKILDAKPDLVVSEFVNDANLDTAKVEERYTHIFADFAAIGAEWAILTPHYVRPDWMNLQREREVDDDPRPYVAGLRAFAATHPVALADAARRYGRMWRQGIPHSTLLVNSINHPDARGMKIFADALMELFP
jgi:lysophospholipase L1-like esterase